MSESEPASAVRTSGVPNNLHAGAKAAGDTTLERNAKETNNHLMAAEATRTDQVEDAMYKTNTAEIVAVDDGLRKRRNQKRVKHGSNTTSSENLPATAVADRYAVGMDIKKDKVLLGGHIAGTNAPAHSGLEIGVLIVFFLVLVVDIFQTAFTASSKITKFCDCLDSQISFRRRKVPELVDENPLSHKEKKLINRSQRYKTWKTSRDQLRKVHKVQERKGYDQRFWLLNRYNDDLYWLYSIFASFALKFVGGNLVSFAFVGKASFPSLLDLSLLSLAIFLTHFSPNDNIYARFTDDFLFRVCLQLGISLYKIRKIFKTVALASSNGFSLLSTIIFAVFAIQINSMLRDAELHFSHLPTFYTIQRLPLGLMDKIFNKETGLVAISALIAYSTALVPRPAQAWALLILSWLVLLYRYERKVFSQVLKLDTDRLIWNTITGSKERMSRNIRPTLNTVCLSVFDARSWTSSNHAKNLSEIFLNFRHVWSRLSSLGVKFFSMNEMRFRLYEVLDILNEKSTKSLFLLMGGLSAYAILSSLYSFFPYVLLLGHNVHLSRKGLSEIQKQNWSNFWLFAALLLDLATILKVMNISPFRNILGIVQPLFLMWLALPVPEIVGNKIQYKEENGITVAAKGLISNTMRFLYGDRFK